jgi:hypothetical protein
MATRDAPRQASGIRDLASLSKTLARNRKSCRRCSDNVCDQEGKIMFERLITAIIMVVALAIVASGLPLSSISGPGSGVLGFFNLPLIF